MMIKVLSFLFLSIFFFYLYQDKYKNSESVDFQPIQENIQIKNFVFKDYFIEKKAKFQIIAKVLNKESYFFDRVSDISPYDFALGWSVMSEKKYLNEIDISQGGRFYSWFSTTMPLSEDAISRNSANMHLIPKNDKVKDILEEVKTDDILLIKGYLVDVSSDGLEWKTSLNRLDTGDGACEIIFVEEVEIY